LLSQRSRRKIGFGARHFNASLIAGKFGHVNRDDLKRPKAGTSYISRIVPTVFIEKKRALFKLIPNLQDAFRAIGILKQQPGVMLTSWIRNTIERRAFGFCQYLGERMHIAPATVRRYFIYISFVGMGSPVIFYLIGAFWLNVRRYARKGRSVIAE